MNKRIKKKKAKQHSDKMERVLTALHCKILSAKLQMDILRSFDVLNCFRPSRGGSVVPNLSGSHRVILRPNHGVMTRLEMPIDVCLHKPDLVEPPTYPYEHLRRALVKSDLMVGIYRSIVHDAAQCGAIITEDDCAFGEVKE